MEPSCWSEVVDRLVWRDGCGEGYRVERDVDDCPFGRTRLCTLNGAAPKWLEM